MPVNHDFDSPHSYTKGGIGVHVGSIFHVTMTATRRGMPRSGVEKQGRYTSVVPGPRPGQEAENRRS